MNELHCTNEELHLEDVPLSLIAEREGTPTYVYSLAAIRDRARRFQTSLAGSPHLACFSVKANSNTRILQHLAEEGLGFDIVSGGELFRVLRAGGDPGKVVFSGVGKTRREMEEALKARILLFNVESLAELVQLHEVASAIGTQAPVALRINPDVDPQTHPYIATGLRKSKFGVPMEQALEAYNVARQLSGLRVIGIDCHIGSQLTDLAPIKEAVSRAVDLAQQLQRRGFDIRFLDVGGGLGVRYRDENPPSIEEYVAAVCSAAAGFKGTLIFEPGRSIVAEAGLLLSRVLFLKSSAEKSFVVVDAAMSDLIRPALYGSYQEIVPVRVRSGAQRVADVVGPVCESGDFLARDRALPPLESGDLIAVLGAGAYGFVMASQYNSRPRPAEVLVDGGRYSVIRRRETYEDLIRGETDRE
jgi:diaminopimelate decarboxylase